MDDEDMPAHADRIAALARYADATFKGRDTRALCDAVASATPEYSLRGYFTFGLAKERHALREAVAVQNSGRIAVMVAILMSRERGRNATPLATELSSLPSALMELIARAIVAV